MRCGSGNSSSARNMRALLDGGAAWPSSNPLRIRELDKSHKSCCLFVCITQKIAPPLGCRVTCLAQRTASLAGWSTSIDVINQATTASHRARTELAVRVAKRILGPPTQRPSPDVVDKSSNQRSLQKRGTVLSPPNDRLCNPDTLLKYCENQTRALPANSTPTSLVLASGAKISFGNGAWFRRQKVAR